MNKVLTKTVQRLKEIAKEKGLTDYAVSRLAGVHPSLIHMVFKGDRNPSIETVEKIAIALDCEVEIRHIIK